MAGWTPTGPPRRRSRSPPTSSWSAAAATARSPSPAAPRGRRRRAAPRDLRRALPSRRPRRLPARWPSAAARRCSICAPRPAGRTGSRTTPTRPAPPTRPTRSTISSPTSTGVIRRDEDSDGDRRHGRLRTVPDDEADEPFDPREPDAAAEEPEAGRHDDAADGPPTVAHRPGRVAAADPRANAGRRHDPSRVAARAHGHAVMDSGRLLDAATHVDSPAMRTRPRGPREPLGADRRGYVVTEALRRLLVA